MRDEHSPPSQRAQLLKEHDPKAIRARLKAGEAHSYLRDAVLGAIDGTVTTFAVVSGAAGADLPVQVALILGCANLFADGFSMAASNYLGTRSDAQMLERARRIEEQHVEQIPEGEREEVRQIYAAKGLKGEVLEEVVNAITSDRRRWVDTMLTEEWGLQLRPPSAVRAGLVTFGAFFLAGLIPLLPLFLPGTWSGKPFLLSAIATAVTFLGIGMLKGKTVEKSMIRSGIETLLLGGGAALLAYLVGALLQGWTG